MTHSNELNHSKKYLFAFISLFVIPLSGLGIDIYTPSLPAVSQYFHVDKSQVQLSITYYMMGLGFTQLFAGSITDSFGRKKPFLIGMFIFVITSILLSLCSSINQLLLLRLVQGIMVGIIIVPMRSVIPDLFTGHDLHKMINYMTMAWAVGPIVAPFLGGYLQQFFGWKANFYFLAIYGLIAFILVSLLLKETSVDRHPFQLAPILKRYALMISNWQFTNGLVINGLLYSIFILFSVVSPFLIQNVLHYSASTFGLMALLVGLGWFTGTIINRALIHISLKMKALVCLWLMLLISLTASIVALSLAMNLYSIMIPIILLACLGGIVFPNYFSYGLSLFPKISGSANALFGSLIFVISGISSGMGSLLRSNSQLPLSLAYLGLTALSLIIYYSSKLSKE